MKTCSMKVYIIDNYDSFTYNLYQYIGEILTRKTYFQEVSDFSIVVKRNNEITLKDIENASPDRIIISPGSGTPCDKDYFGICEEVIRDLGPTIPILGVCLGMQGIAHTFGGNIIEASIPIHGKTTYVLHTTEDIFEGIPNPIEVMRYHSLIVEYSSLPTCFDITAVVRESTQMGDTNQLFSYNDEIMAIKHKYHPIYGIQFHPESFYTEGGKDMISNFLFI